MMYRIARFLSGCWPLLLLLSTTCFAQPPDRLAIPAAERIIRDGDRLADAGDFLKAVESYTTAYLSIVSEIRGDDFVHVVQPTLMTRSELGVEMLREMEQEYTEEELRLMEACYKIFGLIPPDLNVKETYTKLLTEEVGGFYDPKTERMVLVREDDGPEPGFFSKLLGARSRFDKEEQKITLAHELTHALQDQLYGLKDLQELVEKDDDMMLAFSALVEGDATLVMFGEMGRQEGDMRAMTEMDPETAKMMMSLMKTFMPVAGGKTFRTAPRIFRETLVFPYLQGMVFNLHLTRADGFRQVHRAYSSPPVSTEQILHPEKYLENPEYPQEFKIQILADSLPTDWNHLGGNCLGELQIDILLRGVPKSSQAAEGWNGDRYEVCETNEGQLVLLWVTTWDSIQDAEEFEQAYLRSLRPKNRRTRSVTLEETSVSQESEPNDPNAERTAPTVPTRVERMNKDVYVIRGVDDEKLVDQFLTLLQSAERFEKRFPKSVRTLAE